MSKENAIKLIGESSDVLDRLKALDVETRTSYLRSKLQDPKICMDADGLMILALENSCFRFAEVMFEPIMSLCEEGIKNESDLRRKQVLVAARDTVRNLYKESMDEIRGIH